MASMIPAMRLARVWRAAKPTMAAASAPEASTLVARRLTPVNCERAMKVPPRMITSPTSRRTKRSRVSTSCETPPRSIRPASLLPRARNQRSTSKAASSARPSVMTAVIHWSWRAQKSAAGMRRSAAAMAVDRIERPRAVLLDAMGTLLTFAPPAPLLRAARQARLGTDVGAEAAERAIRAEIAFYRAHLHEGGDEAGLAALRRASAEAMRPALPGPVADADGALLTEALLDALRFAAFPEV